MGIFAIFQQPLQLWKSWMGLDQTPYVAAPVISGPPSKEKPYMYEPGGFHRVTLGETFDNERYTVLQKLGFGQYSTVWLALDSR